MSTGDVRNIPAALKRHKNFLVWKYVPDPQNPSKKPRKIPFYTNGQVRRGEHGAPEDLVALSSFEDAVNTADMFDYDGIGIAMTPELGLVGIDLDDIGADAAGPDALDPRRDLIAGTYAEISPSGNGLRAFYEGFYENRRTPGVEVFCTKGFLTLTGNKLNGDKITPLPDHVKAHLAVLAGPPKSTRQTAIRQAENDDPIYQALVKHGMVRRNFGNGKIGITCPFADEHTTGDGDADAVYFIPHTHGYTTGNFHCLHAHCADRAQDEFTAALGISRQPTVAEMFPTGATPEETDITQRPGESIFARASAITLSGLTPDNWLLKYRYLTGQVTATAAPPGVGKSLMSLLEAVAIATGKKDICHGVVSRKTNVWYHSAEETYNTIAKRVYAIKKRFNLSTEDLRGLVYTTGDKLDLKIVTADTRGRPAINTNAVEFVKNTIIKGKIGLFIVDPLAEIHTVAENDNDAIKIVGVALREIARQTECCVGVIHHTSKGKADPGNMDKGRGGSAFAGVARVYHTLYPMASTDAPKYGLAAGKADWYVRLDKAKQSYAPPGEDTVWYQKMSEKLFFDHTETTPVLVMADLSKVAKETGDEYLGQVVARIVRCSRDVEAGKGVSAYQIAKRAVDDELLDEGSVSTVRRRIREFLGVPLVRPEGTYEMIDDRVFFHPDKKVAPET